MREIVKIRVSIATLTRQTSSKVRDPNWAFEKLKTEFGEFVDSRTGIFRYEGDLRASQTVDVVGLLESVGVVLIWDMYPFSPESLGHQVEGRREFDSEDFERANCFLIQPKEEIAKSVGLPSGDGTLEFEIISSRKKKRLGYAQFGGVYCTDSVRLDLKSRAFEGLAFRRTVNPKSGIFEITSPVVLPPVKNLVVNEETGVLLPEQGRCCCGIQDIFLPHQPHFFKSALSDYFDVARTIETWHWPTKCHLARPWIIVSRRFKNWCCEMGFQIDWIPIFDELTK